MSDQLRYNEGKAKLSYLYANRRAIQSIRYDVEPSYDAMLGELQRFLSGGPREHLERAAGASRMALELELGGSIRTRYTRKGRILVDCYAADDETCRVYVFGERKYARGNYRKGAPLTDYIDSTLRHAREIRKHRASFGQNYTVSLDAESKLAHGAHIFWNLWQALDQPDSRDDRLAPVVGGEYDPEEIRRRATQERLVAAFDAAPFKWDAFAAADDEDYSSTCGALDGCVLCDIEFEITTDPANDPEARGNNYAGYLAGTRFKEFEVVPFRPTDIGQGELLEIDEDGCDYIDFGDGYNDGEEIITDFLDVVAYHSLQVVYSMSPEWNEEYDLRWAEGQDDE